MIFKKLQTFVYGLFKRQESVSFKSLGISDNIITTLTNHGFLNPTDVQGKTIPSAIEGKNIFCSSETGSGKTLAFILPMVEKLIKKEIHQALILCPTREIANQINKVLSLFTSDEITSALVIGGTNVAQQKAELRKYPKVLVATPGRLLDMLSTGYIWLDHSDYVVLDEADRMLDMGFEDELTQITEHLSGTQQTVLFSATLFPSIKKLAKKYAAEFEEIILGNPQDISSSIEHVLIEVDEREKFNALKYLIRTFDGKVIVFFNSIDRTTKTTTRLNRARFKDVDCLHSKISQSNREAIIQDFRDGEIRVLLASDIASRGIDIPSVNLVINYDLPFAPEEYIHRVGRTGRGGQTGLAISFSSDRDRKKLIAIEALLEAEIVIEDDYKSIL